MEKLADMLDVKGYQTQFTYIANPVTLLYSDQVPEGLEESIGRLGIADRLEKRPLKAQFEGIAPDTDYDAVILNYYHERRPLLRHKRDKYFLHLNYQSIEAYEPSDAWKWITENFDIVDTEPNKCLQRFIGLVCKIRTNFPHASILIINFKYMIRV